MSIALVRRAPSSTTRVHGIDAAIACCSSASNSDAFRSSLSTARLAFLWRILQLGGLTMQTLWSRTARRIGWSMPSRSTSS